MKLSIQSQLFLVTAIVLAVYYPVLFAGLNPVDDQNLVDGLLNSGPFDLYRQFFPGAGYYYRPLTFLLFYFDRAVWGMEPSFLHLGNMLIHALNVLLVYAVTASLFKINDRPQKLFPLCAALLFGLHPINTESVCWISGRTDLLACTFILAAMWCQIEVFRSSNKRFLVLAVGMFFASCLAKETAIFFLGGAIFLEYALCRRSCCTVSEALRRCVVPFTLWTAAAFAYLGLRAVALGGHDSGISTAATMVSGDAALFDKIRIALKVMGFYFKKLFMPMPLNFGIINVHDAYVLLGVLLLILILLLIWKLNQASAFFLSAFCLVLVSLLVALGQMAWTPIAERYLYLSSPSFVFGCTLLYDDYGFRIHGRLRTLLMSALLFVCAATTYQRSLLWSDPVAFFEDTIHNSPDFVPAYNELASLYYGRGNSLRAEELLALVAPKVGNRSYVAVDISRATLLLNQGKLDESRGLLLERLKNPGKNFATVANVLIQVDFARISAGLSADLETSARQEVLSLLQQMNIGSDDPFLRYRLGKAYLKLGLKAEAMQCFDFVYKESPSDAYYREPAGKLYRSLNK